MGGMKHTLLAFFAASLIPALALSLLYPISPSHPTGFASVAFGTGFFYLFTFPFTLLVALPVYWVLRATDLVRWWSATGCGLGVGAIAVLCLYKTPEARDYLLGTSLGSFSGFVFWFIWSRGQHAAQQGAPGDGPRFARPAPERRRWAAQE